MLHQVLNNFEKLRTLVIDWMVNRTKKIIIALMAIFLVSWNGSSFADQEQQLSKATQALQELVNSQSVIESNRLLKKLQSLQSQEQANSQKATLIQSLLETLEQSIHRKMKIVHLHMNLMSSYPRSVLLLHLMMDLILSIHHIFWMYSKKNERKRRFMSMEIK